MNAMHLSTQHSDVQFQGTADRSRKIQRAFKWTGVGSVVVAASALAYGSSDTFKQCLKERVEQVSSVPKRSQQCLQELPERLQEVQTPTTGEQAPFLVGSVAGGLAVLSAVFGSLHAIASRRAARKKA